MRTNSISFILGCSAIISMALINPQPAFATYCQVVSLTSGSCPNPPPKNPPTYPLTLPRHVTILGYYPYIGGSSTDGGFFNGPINSEEL